MKELDPTATTKLACPECDFNAWILTGQTDALQAVMCTGCGFIGQVASTITWNQVQPVPPVVTGQGLYLKKWPKGGATCSECRHEYAPEGVHQPGGLCPKCYEARY